MEISTLSNKVKTSVSTCGPVNQQAVPSGTLKMRNVGDKYSYIMPYGTSTLRDTYFTGYTDRGNWHYTEVTEENKYYICGFHEKVDFP